MKHSPSVLKRALLFAAVAVAFTSVPAAAQSHSSSSGAVLNPGDAVRITVWRKPELSGEFELTGAGTIDHPIYQSVQAAGVPVSEVHRRLNVFLLDWEAEPRFTVKPLFRVAVGGEVLRPSLYTLAPEVTIAQAVATAGGVTDRGRLTRVRVLRSGSDMTVDLTRSDSHLALMTVRSGDQIIVERRREVFREYIAPAGTIAMAAVSLLNILLR
jgi:protein involved in polysaccharide export with SLBB domain